MIPVISFFTLSNFRSFFLSAADVANLSALPMKSELRSICVFIHCRSPPGKCVSSMVRCVWQQHKFQFSSGKDNNEMALIMKVFFAPRKIAKIVIARAPDNCTNHEMAFAIISEEREMQPSVDGEQLHLTIWQYVKFHTFTSSTATATATQLVHILRIFSVDFFLIAQARKCFCCTFNGKSNDRRLRISAISDSLMLQDADSDFRKNYAACSNNTLLHGKCANIETNLIQCDSCIDVR